MDIKRLTKSAAIITGSLFLAVCSMSIPSIASAQQTVLNGDVDSYVIDKEPLKQAQLDQVLAPIALYPDSLLSQILVAATYPLEVVQASRWRQANQSLTEKQVLAAIEDKQWDPSVKALTPFTDLLDRLSKDLDWLQQLGDAFLQNEEQVLASIQDLRQKARDNGSIADNDYYNVVEDDNNIIIKSTSREIVYVPYYDSRVVYGPWGWNDYQPVYWNRPSHSRLHAGFYWSDRYYIRPTVFFGGFHWNSRNLVVNHHFYDRQYRHNNRYRNNRYRNVHVSDYRHWNHNPRHRRGVRYLRNDDKNPAYRNQFNRRSRANSETRERVQERRGDGNSVVSSNPRKPENLRRIQRNRLQQNDRKPRRYERIRDRLDRDNLASRQRSNTSESKPTTRAAATIVKSRESYRSRNTANRSAPRQQSASRSGRNDSKANRSNTAANVRTAPPVANNPPKRTTAPRQSNTNKSNNNSTSRSSASKAPKSNPRHKTMDKRSHRKPK